MNTEMIVISCMFLQRPFGVQYCSHHGCSFSQKINIFSHVFAKLCQVCMKHRPNCSPNHMLSQWYYLVSYAAIAVFVTASITCLWIPDGGLSHKLFGIWFKFLPDWWIVRKRNIFSHNLPPDVWMLCKMIIETEFDDWKTLKPMWSCVDRSD